MSAGRIGDDQERLGFENVVANKGHLLAVGRKGYATVDLLRKLARGSAEDRNLVKSPKPVGQIHSLQIINGISIWSEYRNEKRTL